ncbi:MAG: hypothetical protein QXQ18_02905 [Candidatus Aenigmatarchaeota archaeon]
MVYKFRNVSSISKSDTQVALIGKITETLENSFLLSDDTGNIEIFFDGPVEKGKIVRVFCRLIDGSLKADIVQELNNFDLNLYKKVKDLYNKVGLDF